MKMKDAAKDMSLEVTIGGMTTWRIRLRIGVALIFVACKIIGCNVRVLGEVTAGEGDGQG